MNQRKQKFQEEKTWVDYDNKYNSRPESITINLLADGRVVSHKK